MKHNRQTLVHSIVALVAIGSIANLARRSEAQAVPLEEDSTEEVTQRLQEAGAVVRTGRVSPAPSRLNQLFERFSAYDVNFGDVRGQEIKPEHLEGVQEGDIVLMTSPFTGLEQPWLSNQSNKHVSTCRPCSGMRVLGIC